MYPFAHSIHKLLRKSKSKIEIFFLSIPPYNDNMKRAFAIKQADLQMRAFTVKMYTLPKEMYAGTQKM